MNPSPSKTHRPTGAALVLTLFMLALLTVLTVSYLSSMRTELRSATAIYNVQETKMIAQGGLAHAISLLRENIPDPESKPDSLALPTGPLPTNLAADYVGKDEINHWAMNPGRLTLENDDIIDLHTGAGTGSAHTYVDLNEPVPGSRDLPGGNGPAPAIAWPTDDNGNPVDLDGTNRPKMRIAWVDVLEDPSQAADANNQIIGRHAFWIDDESAKLNYNIALGKPDTITTSNSYGTFTGRTTPKYVYTDTTEWGQTGRLWSLGLPQGTNMDVVLDDLGLTTVEETDLLVSKFYNFWSQGGVKTPEGILSFLPPPPSVTDDDAESWYHRNKFNLTHYSRAPEINAFGRLRILPGFGLISLETSGLFQHPFEYNGISHNYGAFHTGNGPGKYARRESIVHNIFRYLTRTDWPGYEGASFVDKYGEVEAFQIALNMLSLMHESGTNSLWTDSSNGLTSQTNNNIRYPSESTLSADDLAALPNSPECFAWINPYAPDTNYLSGFHEHIPQNRGPYISEVVLHVQPVKCVSPADRDGDPNTDHYNLKVWWEAELYLPPYSFGLDSDVGSNDRVQNDYLGVRIDTSEPLKMKIENFAWDASPGTFPTHWTLNGNPSGGAYGGYSSAKWERSGWFGWPNVNYHADFDPTDSDGDPTTNLGVQLGPTGSLREDTTWTNKNFRMVTMGRDCYVAGLPNRPSWQSNTTTRENICTRIVLDLLNPNSANLDVDVNLRLGISTANGFPIQIVPYPYENDGDTRTDFDPGSVFNAPFTFTEAEVISETEKVYSFQVNDPTRGHFLSEWKGAPGPGTPGGPNEEDPTNPNIGWPAWNDDEYNSPHFAKLRGQETSGERFRPPGFPGTITLGSQSYLNTRPIFPGSGAFNIVRNDLATENSDGWGTLAFNDNPAFANSTVTPAEHEALPDHLLLDLVSACYPNTANQVNNANVGPDSYSSITYQHSCAGRVNLNTKSYPEVPGVFEAPNRHRPLKGVFRYLRSDDDIDDLVTEIAAGPDPADPDRPFFYTGEISLLNNYEGSPPITASDESSQSNNHAGLISEPEWSKDELLRNLNGCLTVNSNTFGIWGAAQKVKKSPANATNHGTFEDGDKVLGEKRFYALVERYLWTGRDGRAGNAHVNPATGAWDRKADSDFTWYHYGQHPGSPGDLFWESAGGYRPWATVDGPVLPEESPVYSYKDPLLTTIDFTTHSGTHPSIFPVRDLEEADNPISPVVKYRVLYFKYLDE